MFKRALQLTRPDFCDSKSGFFCFLDRRHHQQQDLWRHRPVVGELQGDLDEGVWTQIVLLGKILAEPLEVEHVHVEVVD